MSRSSIAIVAAKSGGHIIPGLTLADQYGKKYAISTVTLFTTYSSFDKKIVDQHGINVEMVSLKFDNVPSRIWHYPKFMVQCLISFFLSLFHFIYNRPERLFVMGGYISIPVSLAAFLLRIHIDLYELNAVPGRATKFLAPLSTMIHVCFKQAINEFNVKKTVIDPYPVRFDSANDSYQKLMSDTGLDSSKKTVLILGGSQGSIDLNCTVKNCIEKDPELFKSLNIIHQIGARDSFDWLAFYRYQNISAIVFDYHPDLICYYQLADLIICRAGAGTIFEALSLKKICVLIPLEISNNNHQAYNAIAISQEHPNLFCVVRKKDLLTCNSLLIDYIKERLILRAESRNTIWQNNQLHCDESH